MYTHKISIRNGELWIHKFGCLRPQVCYRDPNRKCTIDCVLFEEIDDTGEETMHRYELRICNKVFISRKYEFIDGYRAESLCACDVYSFDRND